MLNQVLEDYGFTPNEAKIYLICLELGSAPVSSIARRMGDNRVTVYSAIKNLVKKGIALEIPKKGSTFYSVISPEKLVQRMEEKYQNIKNSLPEFLAISNIYDNKPKVQFFEGLEGLKQVYDDLLVGDKETISSFLGVGSISPKLLDYLNLQFLPKRVKIGIHAKVLMCSNDEKTKYHVYTSGKEKELLTEYKIMNYDFVNLYNEINIYGSNKISFIMSGEDEMSAIIIHSKKLHDSLKSIFDLIWQFCPQNVKQRNSKKHK